MEYLCSLELQRVEYMIDNIITSGNKPFISSSETDQQATVGQFDPFSLRASTTDIINDNPINKNNKKKHIVIVCGERKQ